MDTREKLSTYSDQEIEDAFTAGFSRSASMNYLESYDVTSELDDDGGHQIVVGVAVMASSPTRDEYGNVDELKQIVAKFDYDMAEIPFVLKEILVINTMEYQAIYVPGKLAESAGPNAETEKVADDSKNTEGVSDLAGSAPERESQVAQETKEASADRNWIPSQES